MTLIELKAYIAARITDNTSGAITPLKHREVENAIADYIAQEAAAAIAAANSYTDGELTGVIAAAIVAVLAEIKASGLEIDTAQRIFSTTNDGYNCEVHFNGENGIELIFQNNDDPALTNKLTINTDGVTFSLAMAGLGVSDNLDDTTRPLTSYIPLSVFKSRFWSSNSAPTVNDDGTKGFNTKSRWLDTTTDIWYECTSAVTGAAVWVAITSDSLSTKELSIRVVSTVPASSSRFVSFGLTGFNAGDQKTLTPRGSYTDVRTALATAQPASGGLNVIVNIFDIAGTFLGIGLSYTIAAGSAAGVYHYTGPALDLTTNDCLLGLSIGNTATTASGSINGFGIVYQS